MEKKLEAFARLLEVMDRLRVECPWDREQTFESLRNNTIEETFELVDAITDGNLQEIRGELGDLLLHVVFYSKIGEEQGAFDVGDVATAICEKLIYRHPHVFGEVDAADSKAVMQNWEQIKLAERKERKGVLAGVPRSLPALVKAYRIGAKAASAGFDWHKPEDVWAKVDEEIGEVKEEIALGSDGRLEEEFGDLLFAVVNAARLYGVDPELALERSNRKFIRRFEALEEEVTRNGQRLKDRSLEDMEDIWDNIKKIEKNGGN